MEINSLGLITRKEPALMIYFFNPGCIACYGLRPKVEDMTVNKFPEMKLLSVDASTNPALTSEAGVYSAPTILVFFEGKEYIRESKYISVDQLEAKISRYYNMIFN